MAHAFKIDTLQLAEDLEAAKGDPRKTARVIGNTIGSIDISDLATKADIAGVKTEIAELKVDLNWIKLIGGAILAVLILPWLAELAARVVS